MADPEDEGKTEEPTEKRLQKLKEDGSVVQSQEFGNFASVIALYIMFVYVLPIYFQVIGKVLKEITFTFFTYGGLTASSVQLLFKIMFLRVILIVVLIGIFPIFFKVVSDIILHGWMWLPKKAMEFKFTNMNPVNGIKKLNFFSGSNMVKNGMSFTKLMIIGIILSWYIWDELGKFPEYATLSIYAGLFYLNHLIKECLIVVLLFTMVLGVSDWRYQVMKFMHQNQMSKNEIKDEHKNTDGDPLIKGKIKSIRMQRYQERMVQFAARADVLVTNPTHFAVGLEYKPDTMNAPVVVALGQDLVALRLKQTAKENDILIVENPPLARALYATCELDQEIPPEHYHAVAEVIGYIMKLKGNAL